MFRLLDVERYVLCSISLTAVILIHDGLGNSYGAYILVGARRRHVFIVPFGRTSPGPAWRPVNLKDNEGCADRTSATFNVPPSALLSFQSKTLRRTKPGSVYRSE